MCKMWTYLGTENVIWRAYIREENIFDKLKNAVHKPKPEPIKLKATKISDINLEKNKREIFTLHDEKDKNKK